MLRTICLIPLAILATHANADDAAPKVVPRAAAAEAEREPHSTVALIDMTVAFKGNSKFKSRLEVVKEEIRKPVQRLKILKTRAEELKKDLANATPAERERVEDEILTVEAETAVLETRTSVGLARDEAAVYREVYADVQRTVATVARERGFTLVIRYDSSEMLAVDDPQLTIQRLNQLVVFSESRLDITHDVIDRLEREYAKAE